ncbi:MAG TPA: ABC transporter permease [Flexivirga sp.]|uniref:ABC transporter permease n=1 Tax=Flexivirga sp. TaxID=1962927 RepID=UPI002D12AFDF|nr:ABC transporter permease [Flexivirga sp.]HWC24631.1 ABC transporter permease [Flexivirga sp.]
MSGPTAYVARPETKRVVALVVALTGLICTMLVLFAWPAANSAPRDLPIVIAGPRASTGPLTERLVIQQPSAYAIHLAPTRADAVRSITDHDAYGALVTSPHGVEVLTASARSSSVAQLLDQVGARAAATAHQPLRMTDVVPAPADDPHGTGITSAVLPSVLAGLACASLSTVLIRRRGDRTLVAAGFSIVGGLAMAAVLQGWIGTLEGPFVANAAVLALTLGAISMIVLGLESLFGTRGLGVGAVLTMLVGNALSAAASAPEMLPIGWGALGQLLPAGAANTALRSVAFFGGNGSARPLAVLTCWLVVGLGLQVGAAQRRRRPAESTSSERDTEVTELQHAHAAV